MSVTACGRQLRKHGHRLMTGYYSRWTYFCFGCLATVAVVTGFLLAAIVGNIAFGEPLLQLADPLTNLKYRVNDAFELEPPPEMCSKMLDKYFLQVGDTNATPPSHPFISCCRLNSCGESLWHSALNS